MGGNLNTMQGIWGSEYMPEIKEGDILFIEDSLKNAATIERSFSLLKLNGVFDKISGIILGKHELFDDMKTGRKPYEILLEVLAERKMILIFAVIIVIIVLILSFYKICFFSGEVHVEKRTFHNSNYSKDKIEESNLIVMISNQSFKNEKVEIEGFVDREQLFKDKFKVGDQHLVTYYYRNLVVGEYNLIVKSEDGAELNETIEIGEKKRWVYITYWIDNSAEPTLQVTKQNKPIGID